MSTKIVILILARKKDVLEYAINMNLIGVYLA